LPACLQSIAAALEITGLSVDNRYVSPNGDGTRDSVRLTFSLSESCTLSVRILEQPVGSLLGTVLEDSLMSSGGHTLVWDALKPSSSPYPDGEYRITFSARNGGATAESWTVVHVDVTKPALLAVYPDTLHSGSNYRNGETVRFTALWDSEMEELSADFSNLDSEYSPGEEYVQSGGEGGYLIVYTISEDNGRADAYDLPVRVTAVDSAGNRTVDSSFRVSLRNGLPRVAAITVLDEDNVYRNGDSVRVLSEWSSSIGIEKVELDLSNLDSFFSPSKVRSSRVSDTSFVSSYKISTTNSFVDGSYAASVTGIDSAGASAAVDTLRLILDNSAPGAIALDAYPASVRTDSVTLSGSLGEPATVYAMRGGVRLSSAATAGALNRFELHVPLVTKENRLSLYAVDGAGNSSDTLSVLVVRVSGGALELSVDEPFEPGDSFKIYLPRKGKSVTIQVFSLGADLIVERKSAESLDNYDIQWNGRNLAGKLVNSGPFFAKITVEYADGGIERKIVPFLFRR